MAYSCDRCKNLVDGLPENIRDNKLICAYCGKVIKTYGNLKKPLISWENWKNFLNKEIKLIK
jgi:DNA-directed RNA polymerase subunit RPC12/RpoP